MLTPPVHLDEVAHACDLTSFSCGEASLDEWLKSWAVRSEDRTARTYVVRSDDRVVAYYCLAMGGIERDRLPRKLKHGTPGMVPVLVLGRLAVDLEFQGQGLGQDLVSHCFRQCLGAAHYAGTRGLVVHPLLEQGEKLVKFYAAAQFQELPGEPLAMFLSIEAIRAAVAARPAP